MWILYGWCVLSASCWRSSCLVAVALCLLPESPRWLVIHGKLDDALAVIHRMYTDNQLPRGEGLRRKLSAVQLLFSMLVPESSRLLCGLLYLCLPADSKCNQSCCSAGCCTHPSRQAR